MCYRNLVEDEKVTILQLKNIFIFSISLANSNEHIEESGGGDKYLTRSNIAIVIAILQRCCANRKEKLIAGWQPRKTSWRWWHLNWDCMDKWEFTRKRIRVSQGGLVVKNPPASAGYLRDAGLIPGLGRSPGRGTVTQSSILAWRIPMDRGAWRATVHGVSKNRTWRKQLSTHACFCRLTFLFSFYWECKLKGRFSCFR